MIFISMLNLIIFIYMLYYLYSINSIVYSNNNISIHRVIETFDNYVLLKTIRYIPTQYSIWLLILCSC
jgi:hypothetical protein